ncbi:MULTISPECIES: LacI family DNA-binding transcriptional regulator [Microbacterium]|uniref:LacI family DNA-binding transcriptional regulator n=1 Tax=Microbacterium TaxID=33882 RepID=UPI00051A64CE|nr:LacI family DNA-binding transcriptional regulator [Microbacterium profundi]
MSEVTARRKPTIRDVAVQAGVSRSTVSRVINGGHWVSPDARVAVEEAIVATGYTANHHARSLATGRAGSMAFLLTEPQQLLFDDPTFALLLRGAAEALAQRAMTLVLLVAGTPAERESVAHFISAGHVDGVLLISSHESEPLLDQLLDSGVPIVSCGVPLGHERELSTISVEEVASAKTMVAYLQQKGYERIGMIAGPDDTPGGRYRLVGFREQLGDDFDDAFVEMGDYSFESGQTAMTRLLERGVDAVFAANDRMAAGAIAAVRRAGLRVPDDVAVAGFDDSGLAATHEPTITTMRQPWEQISAQMVSVLLDAIAGAEPRSVILDTELVVRESA